MRKAEYRRRFREFFDNEPSASLSSRYHEALSFVFHLPCDQRRKGSEVPYISHLLQVSGLVLEAGGDEDQAIAGLLHDAIEDAPDDGNTVHWIRDQIRNRFGTRVLSMVEACTDTRKQSEPPWKERAECYLKALPGKPCDALLVSAADKLHDYRTILSDLRSVGSVLWEGFAGRREGTLWCYRALADAYEQAFDGDEGPALIRELRPGPSVR